jgi:hypothetical protein
MSVESTDKVLTPASAASPQNGSLPCPFVGGWWLAADNTTYQHPVATP